MAAIPTATGGAPTLRHTNSSCRRCRQRHIIPSNKLNGSIKFLIQTPADSFSASSIQRQFTIQASENSQVEEQETSIDDDAGAASFQEDLNYVWKLVVGSFVGAAVIKYGSIIFPEITRPNILLAMVMISSPVVATVWLLVKQSPVERQN